MTTDQKTPADIEDVNELRREIRLAILDNDHERQSALEAQYQQWRVDHAEEIGAAHQRQERDAADIAEQKRKDAYANYRESTIL
jgi:hypothetical protein